MFWQCEKTKLTERENWLSNPPHVFHSYIHHLFSVYASPIPINTIIFWRLINWEINRSTLIRKKHGYFMEYGSTRPLFRWKYHLKGEIWFIPSSPNYFVNGINHPLPHFRNDVIRIVEILSSVVQPRQSGTFDLIFCIDCRKHPAWTRMFDWYWFDVVLSLYHPIK